MPNTMLRFVALPWVVVVACGCTVHGSMRESAWFDINTPQPHTVQAGGYPGERGDDGSNLHYSVSIHLQSARPFVFVFPDGYRAISNSITAEILEAHFAPVTVEPGGRRSSRIGSVQGWERHDISFDVNAAGLATGVWLYACRRQIPRVLATVDGSRIFDFPIRQRDLEALVGPASRSGRGTTLLGGHCDAGDWPGAG